MTVGEDWNRTQQHLHRPQREILDYFYEPHEQKTICDHGGFDSGGKPAVFSERPGAASIDEAFRAPGRDIGGEREQVEG